MNLEKSKALLSIEGLTSKQIGIIENTVYPTYIKAGAGTGKTEVLTRKILQIVADEQIGLDRLAVITFTNKATTELKARLTALLYAKWRQALEQNDSHTDFYRLQVEQVSMANITTIHGFCSTLLRTYGIYIGISPEFIVSSANRFINDAIQRNVDGFLSHPIMKNISGNKMILLVREFLRHCDTHGLKIDSKTIQDSCSEKDAPFWKEFKPCFLKLVQEIQSEVAAYKEERFMQTVDDLIQKTSELFSDENLCCQICKKYSVVFIDETQDTDPLQFYIVSQMIKQGVRVFAVGDDQQAIYSFRGADVESSYEMAKSISERNSSERLILNENFRSDAKLISTFNKIFKYDFKYFSNKLSFPYFFLRAPAEKTESESKPFQMVYNLSVSQIVERLIESTTLKGRQITYDDVAILCRRNYEVAQCAEALKAAGIPTQVIGGRGFYQAKEILDIFKLLKAALIGSPLLQTELQYTDYYQFMETEQIKEFLTELRIIAKEQSLEELLYYVCENSGIEQFYSEKRRYQSIANLHKLRDMARGASGEMMQPLEFVEFLNRMICTKQEEDEAEIKSGSAASGVVSIYTIHRAKGLAFNIVLFPFADTALIGNKNQPKFLYRNHKLGFNAEFLNGTDFTLPEDTVYTGMTEQETLRYLEEELRVVYVCLTRARHKVIVACKRSKQKFEELMEIEDYVSPAKWIKQAIK